MGQDFVALVEGAVRVNKLARCVVGAKKRRVSVRSCKRGSVKVFRTSVNDGHRHSFKEDNKFTSVDKGHKHRVVRGVALPIVKGDHRHRVLKS